MYDKEQRQLQKIIERLEKAGMTVSIGRKGPQSGRYSGMVGRRMEIRKI
jgi:hypothetical protein